MNVTETSAEGLRRELRVVIGADELERRLSARLDEIKDRVRLKGFRPGHVPKDHLRKVYGRSVMSDVVQQAVAETSRQAISDRQERLAFQPQIALPQDESEIDKVFSGAGDLAYTMSFEVLPKIELMDFKKLTLERPVAEVTAANIDAALARMAEANLRYTPKGGTAEDGDRLVIDFVGKVDGERFESGSTEDAAIVLGSGQFIPGFEEGLKGARSGEAREVDASFPETYPQTSLAGKTARFEVKVKEVSAPSTPPIDDNFAKSFGLENLEQLRDNVKKRLEQDRAATSRLKFKRTLLDALNKGHDFELPPTLVDNEFETIWQQVKADLKLSKRSFEDESTTEEKARAEYRDIAARRVRLGLVLSEVGTRNKIKVTDEEVNRALLDRIRQFPGQGQKVYDFYRKDPQMLAELRAPLFEDKVVDFITELAKVTEKAVSVEELYADEDGSHAHRHHSHDHDHEHGHHRHDDDHDHDYDHHHHDRDHP
jgi:trigger factor